MRNLPTGLFTGVQLDERCTHKWQNPEINQIQTQKQAKQNDWPKETWKKCPIKVIQTTMRVWLSLWVLQCVSTHTVPFFLLINMFHCFHLWGNYFLQSWRARALSLTTSLVTRIWHSHYHGWSQSLVGNQNLASRHCRPRPSNISIPLYRSPQFTLSTVESHLVYLHMGWSWIEMLQHLCSFCANMSCLFSWINIQE